MPTRDFSTNLQGSPFSEGTKLAVWLKGRTDMRYDANVYRMDSWGSWMEWSKYGQTVEFGWEIDHIVPVAKGGTDAISNLQPLMWRNNRIKRDQL